MQWLEPWSDVADLGHEFAATFERVLAREVAAGHTMYNVPVVAIGKKDDTDDVLFQLLDGSGRVAIIHLTWTQSPPDRPPWPHTELFASVESFVTERMRPDHEEFVG